MSRRGRPWWSPTIPRLPLWPSRSVLKRFLAAFAGCCAVAAATYLVVVASYGEWPWAEGQRALVRLWFILSCIISGWYALKR